MRKDVPAQPAAQNAPEPPASAKPATEAREFELATAIGPEKTLGRGQLKAAAPSAMAGGVVGGNVAAPAAKSEAAVRSRGENAVLAKRAALGSRWSISDSGALQRSFDAGRSWKEVAVADGVRFRAVATVGAGVWAGGSGGALYHSADGGEHWLWVRVRANGRALEGDIVRIDFDDAKTGVVITSSGETWTTSNGGTAWSLQ
jgi:photosystem II stability/assembly factor-like uncharacterized protein